MKKIIATLMVLCLVLAMTACSKSADESTTAADSSTADQTTTDTAVSTDTSSTDTASSTDTSATDSAAAEETDGTSAATASTMTYAEYMAADYDTEVKIFTYVQDKQSWWDNKATLYTQDNDGAYFIYNAACTEEDYAKLTPGTAIIVTGYKSQWSGEIEIADATFTFAEDAEPVVFDPVDVTDVLASDNLIDYQNRFVKFTGMTVEPSTTADGSQVAFLYNWDGSGSEGSDLYFNVSYAGATYQFTVESYLRGADTDVYKAVEAMNIGDTVDMTGYLYWYEGANPHIISIATTAAAPAAAVKSEGVMTYAEYAAAEYDAEVVVETYVQAKQSWWNDTATVYTQDEDGAYFIYNMACSEEDYAKLVPGTKIKVTGYKSQWSGEIEIADASFEIEDGSYIAEAVDLTALLGTDSLIDHQNQYVCFGTESTALTVAPSTDANGNEVAYLYKWNGSGSKGDDLYFNVTDGTNVYSFTVESYLCGQDTEVYQTVESLQVGQQISVYGFLYWYEGANPHCTQVIVK